jgi:hypothetical protein
VYVLLGISPASNCSWPTFRNPVSVPSSKAGRRLCLKSRKRTKLFILLFSPASCYFLPVIKHLTLHYIQEILQPIFYSKSDSPSFTTRTVKITVLKILIFISADTNTDTQLWTKYIQHSPKSTRL